MEFYPGFDISPQQEPFGFCYGKGVFGPEAEIRRLDDIRASLEDPGCAGPEAVYSISMDVGMEEDREEIEKRNLLYGAVTYAAGTLGREPVRSQGAYPRREHFLRFLHAGGVRDLGRPGDYLYAGVRGGRSPGPVTRFTPVPGDVVIVPPYWVHATVNGGANRPMTFGAWCVRDYGFEYGQVRAHGGIAYFPYVEDGGIRWRENPRLPLPWIDGEGTKGVYGIRNPQGRSGVRPVPGTEGPV